MSDYQKHPLEGFVGSLADLADLPPPDGRAAEHTVGVGYYAPWEDPFDGFAEHSRRNALALATTGVPVQLRSINPGGQLPFDGAGNFVLSKARRRVAKRMESLLLTTVTQYGVQVYQLVGRAADFQNVVTHGQMDPEALRTINRYTVIYTVFERGKVSEHFVAPLKRAGQVWVACQQNAEVLVAAGLSPGHVRIVPMPYFDDDPLLKLNERKRLPGVPRFYHIGKWEPRKQHHRIIGAFMLAFKPSEARMWIKTSSHAPKMGDYPRSPAESVHRWLEHNRILWNGWTVENVNRSIYFIQEAITEERIRELHRLGDVYVTLSQGEGFDMPAFDAKLAGNLMVYTPSGGPRDFHGERDVLVPSTGQVEAHPFYGWEKGATYLDYDLDAAAKAMRNAASAVRAGQRCRGTFLTSYQAKAVGQRMRQHLEELLGGPLVA
jgi:hypothetical protein